MPLSNITADTVICLAASNVHASLENNVGTPICLASSDVYASILLMSVLLFTLPLTAYMTLQPTTILTV